MTNAVCGDTIEAIDDSFAQRIQQRTELRRIKTFARAKEMCDAAGIDPSQVGLKLLRPIWNGASVEEDESMAERWAALLANAASAAGPEVRASYSSILAELGPQDAAFVDALYEQDSEHYGGLALRQGRMVGGADVRGIAADIGLTDSDLAVIVENAVRLGLCERVIQTYGGVPVATTEVLAVTDRVERTALGAAFVQACTPPKTIDA